MVLTVKNNISWFQYETGVGFVRFQTRIKIQNQNRFGTFPIFSSQVFFMLIRLIVWPSWALPIFLFFASIIKSFSLPDDVLVDKNSFASYRYIEAILNVSETDTQRPVTGWRIR